jgi:hypothetical protein
MHVLDGERLLFWMTDMAASVLHYDLLCCAVVSARAYCVPVHGKAQIVGQIPSCFDFGA